MSYLFAVDNSFRRGSERRHGLLFLLLGLVLFTLYFAIRRMFRPIQSISRQVELIGKGDLEQRINDQGKGELALLSAGIDRMATQIKSMLESKSALLLAISHELRSPITRMRVNLELLDESDIQRKLIEDIREIESLVAAILESERLNKHHAPLNLARCEVADLVKTVIETHHCRDRISSSLSPVETRIDEMRIKLLLKNLLDNACQYSSEEQGFIEVSLREESGRLLMSVVDRGIGIPQDEIAQLTEAFYRPDRARQRDTGGYGLGLYLCRLIAEAHGGIIRIESEPGKGTEVIVELPIDNS